jgi:hypothetical protein
VVNGLVVDAQQGITHVSQHSVRSVTGSPDARATPSLQRQFEEGTGLVMAHPVLFGTMALVACGGVLTAATVLVSVLALPALLVFAPAGLGAAVSGGTGLWLLRQHARRRGRAGLEPELQTRLLHAAAAAGGRLTVTSAAHAAGITLEQAERVLGEMAKSGYVDAELEPHSGVLVYVFREIGPQAPAVRRLPG